MGRIDGKIALITGAATGIGVGVARMFVDEGARVAITDIATEPGEALAAELGDSAIFCRLDVSDEQNWRDAIASVEAHWGPLDILVQSAGVSRPAHIEDADLDEWRAHMAVHGEGAFLGCKYAIASMKKAGAGSIVNISSVESIRPGPLFVCYGAAKAAQDAVTKTVALHCGEKGYNIRCNSLHPAATYTPLLQQYLESSDDPEGLERIYAGMQPLNRIASVEEIARSVLFLASDDASFITGHQLYVDGGVLAKPYPAGEGA